MDKPQYKTWVRTRPIVILSVLAVMFLALSSLAVFNLLFLAFLVPAGLFAYIVAIVGLSRWRFSPTGGDYQARVHQLLVDRAEGDSVLDIGCGSGHLLSKVARALPAAKLTGVDLWPGNWEYSRDLCLANFRAEGLDGRATFVQGSAANLPANLGEFDTVLSCLTFHEVSEATDKTVSLSQAIARVRPGGRFAFIDLFGDPKFYPDPARIEAAIAQAGGEITERVPLSDLLPLPFPLKHKRVLGGAMLIAGRKHRRA